MSQEYAPPDGETALSPPLPTNTPLSAPTILAAAFAHALTTYPFLADLVALGNLVHIRFAAIKDASGHYDLNPTLPVTVEDPNGLVCTIWGGPGRDEPCVACREGVTHPVLHPKI